MMEAQEAPVLEFSGDLDLRVRHIFDLFVREGRSRGLKNKDMEKFLRYLSGIEAHFFRREIMDRAIEELKIGPSVPTYSFLVSYDRPIENYFEIGGFRAWHPALSSENFRTNQTGTQPVKISLIHIGKPAKKENVWGKLEEMTFLGWRPAELRELLTFGQIYPWLSERFPIMTFDSIRSWPNRLLYPFLFDKTANLTGEGFRGFSSDTRFVFVGPLN